MACCRRELPLPRILPPKLLLGIWFSTLKRFRRIDLVKGLLPCGAQPEGNREHQVQVLAETLDRITGLAGNRERPIGTQPVVFGHLLVIEARGIESPHGPTERSGKAHLEDRS